MANVTNNQILSNVTESMISPNTNFICETNGELQRVPNTALTADFTVDAVYDEASKLIKMSSLVQLVRRVDIDGTLKVSGAGADAKAVGEIIAQMQNKIEELESKLNSLDISAIKISNNNESI